MLDVYNLLIEQYPNQRRCFYTAPHQAKRVSIQKMSFFTFLHSNPENLLSFVLPRMVMDYQGNSWITQAYSH